MTLCAEILGARNARAKPFARCRTGRRFVGGGPTDMIFVRALGAAHIEAGDSRITPQSMRKFALLLHLSAEGGRRVSRGTLQELMYPGLTAEKAGHALRELVYQLRQSGVDVQTDKHGLQLAREAVRSDYSEVIERDRPDEAQLRAVEGGFLPGYAPSHSEAYTEWYEGWKGRVTFDINRVLLRELARARRAADWLSLERAARASLALDCLNEEATLALAESLALGGAKTQAVNLLDAYIAEVKPTSELRVPATILRRRITDRVPESQGRTNLPFVGREREMSSLSTRLAAARRGEAQLIVISGDPGIGKTRILDEFCCSAALAGASVERASVQPHDAHRPLAAFMDIMPRALQLPGALGCSPAALCALQRLTGATPQLVEELSLASSDGRFDSIRSAIIDVISAIVHESLLVLAIDDAHWLDIASLQLLASLSASEQSRLLILLSTRDGGRVSSAVQLAKRVTCIDVGALTGAASERLITTGLGSANVEAPDALVERIRIAAGGNPLFLSALVAEAAQTRLTGDVSRSFADLVDERIRRLSSNALTTLVVAALLGRHCDIPRLVRAVGISTAELLPALAELETAQFIQATSSGGFIAPHALVTEAALRRAPALVISAAHHVVAEVLHGMIDAQSPSALLWDYAEHLLAAGDVDKAIEAFRSCARQALSMGRPREAAQLLLSASGRLPATEIIPIVEDAVRIAHAGWERELVQEGVVALRMIGRGWRHDEIEIAEIGSFGFDCHDATQRMSQLRSCMTDDTASAEHRRHAAELALIFADNQRDEQLAQDCLRVFERQVGDELFDLRVTLMYHSTFGDLAKAAILARNVVEVCRRTPDEAAADLQRKAGIGLIRAGCYGEALDTWRSAFASAQRAGMKRLQFTIALMLATHYSDFEDEAASGIWMREAKLLEQGSPRFASALEFIGAHADAAAARGDYVALRHCYREVIRHSDENGSSRVTRWLPALDVLLRFVSRRRVDVDHEVQRLTSHHRRNMEAGDVSDFEMATALWLLGGANRHAEARTLLAEYVKAYRHHLTPLWATLRQAARSVDGWDEVLAIMADRRRIVAERAATLSYDLPTTRRMLRVSELPITVNAGTLAAAGVGIKREDQ